MDAPHREHHLSFLPEACEEGEGVEGAVPGAGGEVGRRITAGARDNVAPLAPAMTQTHVQRRSLPRQPPHNTRGGGSLTKSALSPARGGGTDGQGRLKGRRASASTQVMYFSFFFCNVEIVASCRSYPLARSQEKRKRVGRDKAHPHAPSTPSMAPEK